MLCTRFRFPVRLFEAIHLSTVVSNFSHMIDGRSDRYEGGHNALNLRFKNLEVPTLVTADLNYA